MSDIQELVEVAYREGWICGTDADTGWQNSNARSAAWRMAALRVAAEIGRAKG